MQYSREVEEMVCVKKGPNHGPAPIPEEGKWVQAKEIKDISGLTHGIGWCAPQQGACKLTLNVMRELFLQIVYGRTQSAFSDDGLVIGAGLEDLGKGLRSQVGTMYGTKAKGTRYLEMAEGYVLQIALDKDDQVCGYQFLSLGKMMDAIKKGMSPNEAYEKNIGTYGRFKAEDGAVKWIDPRKQ